MRIYIDNDTKLELEDHPPITFEFDDSRIVVYLREHGDETWLEIMSTGSASSALEVRPRSGNVIYVR